MEYSENTKKNYITLNKEIYKQLELIAVSNLTNLTT